VFTCELYFTLYSFIVFKKQIKVVCNYIYNIYESNITHNSMKSISIIVAIDQNYGIGKKGTIPWHSQDDMKQFQTLTTGNTVIMGRKTWDSLPISKRPLLNRRNVVITSGTETETGIGANMIYTNIEDAIEHETILQQTKNNKNTIQFNTTSDMNGTSDVNGTRDISNNYKIFIIGGASLYDHCLTHPLLREIYLTTIHHDYQCDVFINEAKLNNIIHPFNNSTNCSTTNQIFIDSTLQYTKKQLYTNKSDCSCKYTINYHGEDNYIKLAYSILIAGDERQTRNSVVSSQFGKRLEYNLQYGFPLLTTKRMFWRGIVEELLWFLRGDTNVKHLREKGVHIWNGNTTRQFLDDNGLEHLKEDDGGAIYSHQWRHFNAKYVDCDTDYTGKGYDQIANCIDQIKHNPTSRRIMFSAWNPSQFKDMSLLPCHVSYQFYVDTKCNELSCMMTQRSADVFLGLPFNIASTALLTTLIAHHCDLKPRQIIINLGDVHIYQQHRNAMFQQLKNRQYGFPQVNIKCKKDKIEDYTFDDIELSQYYCNQTIKAKMIP